MTFRHEGFSVEATGWVLLQDLKGNGSPAELRKFFRKLSNALDGQVLIVTVNDPARERVYSRLGFSLCDSDFCGQRIMVRTI